MSYILLVMWAMVTVIPVFVCVVLLLSIKGKRVSTLLAIAIIIAVGLAPAWLY
jgi:hypothetical protein